MMELIHKLRHLMMAEHIDPAHVRITVEFLDPGSQERAEFALRKKLQGISFDARMCEAICDEKPFTILGISMLVNRFRFPPKLGCNCAECRQRRREIVR